MVGCKGFQVVFRIHFADLVEGLAWSLILGETRCSRHVERNVEAPVFSTFRSTFFRPFRRRASFEELNLTDGTYNPLCYIPDVFLRLGVFAMFFFLVSFEWFGLPGSRNVYWNGWRFQLDDEANLYVGNGWKSPFPSNLELVFTVWLDLFGWELGDEYTNMAKHVCNVLLWITALRHVDTPRMKPEALGSRLPPRNSRP